MPFLLGVNNGHVEFAYTGWYKNLVERSHHAGRSGVGERAARPALSDQQWRTRSGPPATSPTVANRFIAKLREKIEQGRALGARAADPELIDFT